MEGLRGMLGQWADPEFLTTLAIGWGGRLVAAIAVFVVGRWIAKALAGWFRRAVTKAGADETLARRSSSSLAVKARRKVKGSCSACRGLT